MRKRSLGLLVVFVVLLGVGCATPGAMVTSYPAMGPVLPPSKDHALKVSNLFVIADISRSMRDQSKIGIEKAFLDSFNQGIPQGLRNNGMRTFGKSAYYHTVLVQPIQKYDRNEIAGLIRDLKAGSGSTPLASALAKTYDDLVETSGNIAILVVSDGENLSRDPIPPTLFLKDSFGKRLCIHTVHVGDSEEGRTILKEVAAKNGCGIAVTAAELESESGMKKFITDVFYSSLREDRDGDGVQDFMDQCPNTPKGANVNSVGCWVIQGLQFDTDKWDIKKEYSGVLDNAVNVLKANPTLEIEIHGHTDNIGSDTYNQRLSERRAQAVKDRLVSKGISADRLTTRGLGKFDPVASNATPEGRVKNRRVEFNVIGK